jgi:putative phosphoribosyl transferase
MAEPLFPDRTSAGRLLAAELAKRALEHPVIYALPRGGVPVAAEIAKALDAPLDLLLVRKIGVPWHEELAAGSIVDGERPDVVVNESIMRAAHVSEADFAESAARELREIERRRALYLPGRRPIPAEGRTAILVDDGIATGASMRAAITAIRRRKPRRIIVAVPVLAPETAAAFHALADDVVYVAAPQLFRAVGLHYRDFHQLDDGEVTALLSQAQARANGRAPAKS